MGRSLIATLILLLTPGEAVAGSDTPQPAGAPPSAAERIDHYRFAPRDPSTFRALAGLGDPDREPYPESRYWMDSSPARRALISRMLPGQRPSDSEFWYVDEGGCRIDYAVNVAEARSGRFGADHPYVAQWLRVQRAVFSACQSRESWRQSREELERPARPVALPPPMTTEDPEIARLQREDRAYQSAALLFYRRDPAARRAFAAIASSSSPHAHTARYMLAALHVREADFYGWHDDPERDARRDSKARAALAEAQAILADPRLADVHPLAQGLIGFLGYHMGDARTRAAQVDSTLDALEAPIARIAADPAAAERYSRARADIGALHGRFEDEAWWLTGSAPAEMTASRAMASQARRRVLAAWLLFPVSPFEREPWAVADRWGEDWSLLSRHADERSEGETGLEWTVIRDSLALSYFPEGWSRIDELIRATQERPTDQNLAAVATAFYHQVRAALMYSPFAEGSGRDQGFREALARVEAWPWRESRHFRELVADMLQYLIGQGRIEDARLLRDRIGPRGEDYQEIAAALLLLAEDEEQFAVEAAAMPERGLALVNLLSIEALARLAERDELPEVMRARFARVAWTRLYALDRPVPERVDRLMRRLNPEITSGWASRPGGRRHSRPLLLDVLRSPGLNIIIAGHQRRPGGGSSDPYGNPGLTAIDTFEHSDNNWWCAWQPDRHALLAAATMYQAFFDGEGERDPLAVAGAPAGLAPLLGSSWLWRSQDLAEQSALARIPSAPQLLAERAVAWRGGGSRAGQDEALALAVRATRYGCQRQGGHGAWSRAAHSLLHSRFAGGEWARRTRWWFDCSHFSGGCPDQREPDPLAWHRWTWEIY